MTASRYQIREFPKIFKRFIGLFLIVLSFGFYSGIFFVEHNTNFSPDVIEENYLGNEGQPNAEVMKFKKSKQQMLTMLHNHILSLSVIFLIVGSLTFMTSAPKKLKYFVMFEPLFSIVFTFGGIYCLWQGVLWMKYIILISGTLMTLCYSLCVLLILKDLLQKQSLTSDKHLAA